MVEIGVSMCKTEDEISAAICLGANVQPLFLLFPCFLSIFIVILDLIQFGGLSSYCVDLRVEN